MDAKAVELGPQAYMASQQKYAIDRVGRLLTRTERRNCRRTGSR
jgi:hypothetical protein